MAMTVGVRDDALRPHHRSNAVALSAMPPAMPAMDSVDSDRSTHDPASAMSDASSSTQPIACRQTPACARRAAGFTCPITASNATAMVIMLTVRASTREAMSLGMLYRLSLLGRANRLLAEE